MNKSLSLRILITLIIFIIALSMNFYYETRPTLAPGQAPLRDIQSVDTLRTQFNSDSGKTRLILLVSPT